jgi:hypothetical protein
MNKWIYNADDLDQTTLATVKGKNSDGSLNQMKNFFFSSSRLRLDIRINEKIGSKSHFHLTAAVLHNRELR